MKKYCSIFLKGVIYDVIELNSPKNGCSGICDYHYHCQGACTLKSIVGSQFRFYTLKIR